MKQKKPSKATEKLFDIINFEVTNFTWDVIVWRDLFNEATIPILNRRTGNLFTIFQRRLFDGHHIRIFRLLDKSRGDQSASMYALSAAVRRDGFDDVAKAMSKHLREMKKLAVGIEWRRNKLIGHVDLDARLGDVSPPTEPTFETVAEICRLASRVVNEYSTTLRGEKPGERPTIAHDFAQYLLDNGQDPSAFRLDETHARALVHELELAQRWRDEHPDHWMTPEMKAAKRRCESLSDE